MTREPYVNGTAMIDSAIVADAENAFDDGWTIHPEDMEEADPPDARFRTVYMGGAGWREWGSNEGCVNWFTAGKCIGMKTCPGFTVGVTKARARTAARRDTTSTTPPNPPSCCWTSVAAESASDAPPGPRPYSAAICGNTGCGA